MATKTEYREYISSEAWRRRRSEFLSHWSVCEHCGIPRWLVQYVYDQDIHVHHRSYARVGCELDEDLAALCPRCHDIETFGRSDKRPIKPTGVCQYCQTQIWGNFGVFSNKPFCRECQELILGPSRNMIEKIRPDGTPFGGYEWWLVALAKITECVGIDTTLEALSSIEERINAGKKVKQAS